MEKAKRFKIGEPFAYDVPDFYQYHFSYKNVYDQGRKKGRVLKIHEDHVNVLVSVFGKEITIKMEFNKMRFQYEQ